MTATVSISESNGSTETSTDNITVCDFGYSTDTTAEATGVNPSNYPIPAGSNSFEKYLRVHLSALGGSTKIKNIKVYADKTATTNCSLKTNATTVSGTYTTTKCTTYTRPVTTASSKATQDMPSSNPGAANLGIAGSLTGELTAIGYSDYMIMQLQTVAGATAGTQFTISFAYDEVA